MKETLCSLFLGPSKFSAVCLKKVLELCMIHSANNYWHVILPLLSAQRWFFSVLIYFSYFILPVLIRAWVELGIREVYDWCPSLQQRPGLQSGFVPGDCSLTPLLATAHERRILMSPGLLSKTWQVSRDLTFLGLFTLSYKKVNSINHNILLIWSC